jgi:hypothetical protein
MVRREMAVLDQHAYYELEVLRTVEKNSRLNTRAAAGKLGVSLKLAHEILKRMVQRGWLHVAVIHSRRWDYFLTPTGVQEKSRLTLEFLDFSLLFYREARSRSAWLCRRLQESGQRQVALLGANELAEIATLGLREWGLDLMAIYDQTAALDNAHHRFLGIPVTPVSALPKETRRPVIVCLYNAQQPMNGRYLPATIPAQNNFYWIFGMD